MSRVEISERKTRNAAINEMPWASWIVKVCCGYIGFEFEPDYLLYVDYKTQKRHLVK